MKANKCKDPAGVGKSLGVVEQKELIGDLAERLNLRFKIKGFVSK